MSKSNAAIMTECFAALTKTQLKRLVRYAEICATLADSETEWLVGSACDIAVWAVTDTRPQTGPQMEDFVGRICKIWDKFAAVHADCDYAFANSTPRQVRSAIRRAARTKGIEV